MELNGTMAKYWMANMHFCDFCYHSYHAACLAWMEILHQWLNLQSSARSIHFYWSLMM